MINIDYMDTKWLDTRGGNIRPKLAEQTSENPTTFNGVYHFLYEELKSFLIHKELDNLQNLVKKKYSTNNGKYKTNEYDNNDSFSLDESISVAAICSRYKFPEEMKRLKIITKQTWFRFYDVIPYLLMAKHNWLQYTIILPLLVTIGMIWTCLKEPINTSGKQLAYVKFKGLEHQWWMRKVFSLCKKLTSYSFTFDYYYPDDEHPISIMGRELYN